MLMDALTKLLKVGTAKVAATATQDQDEEMWLFERTKGIGGSDVGPIMGVSPFTSARQIYMNKTGQFEGDSDRLVISEASAERMHFGHMLEPVVADEYALRTGRNIHVVPATLCHKDHPWARVNIDRLITWVDDNGEEQLGVLECKTTSEYNNDNWDSGEILLTYVYQLQWSFFVTGLQRGAFACLVGGNKFYEYEVWRDDELINNILFPAMQHFWFENVGKLVEPEMQAADTDFVNKEYSDVVKNSEIVLDGDEVNELAATVVQCKAEIKELTTIMEAAQNKLKDRLQNNEIGYTRDFTVFWSPRTQSRVDTERLKKEYKEVYDNCQKTISFRAMSIKGGPS